MYKRASKRLQAYTQGEFTKTPETKPTNYFPFMLESMWKEQGQFKYQSRKEFFDNIQDHVYPCGLSVADYDADYKIWFGKHSGEKIIDIEDKQYLTWAVFKFWNEHPKLRKHILYVLNGNLQFSYGENNATTTTSV